MSSLPEPLARLNIVPPWNEPCPLQRGVLNEQGMWYPLLSLKGYALYNSYKRNVLASGSRKSGKTIGVGNRFLRHLWEVDGAVGGVIAKTAKNAKIGVWRDLKSYLIPGWVNGGFGFKVLKQASDPTTKMEYITIRNAHGGESELQLHSLDYEFDVEEKFKSSRFSALWLSEADQFKDRIVYDILEDQLRMVGVPFEQHQFFFDCNPPLEGDEHWLHDVFYKGADSKSKHHNPQHAALFEKFEFGLDDNPFLDERERTNLEAKYQHDPVKFARFCRGQWVRDTAAGHFDETFLFNIHVVGNTDAADRKEWEVLTPHANAVVLLTGTDIGDLNHATSFICPRINAQDEVCYDVFDEVCSIDQKVSVAAFAAQVHQRVQFWNEWFMRTYGTKEPPLWRHWGDSSLFNYHATANNNDAQIFWEVSDGTIAIRPVVKGAGSIRQRIAMCQRLFFANRLFMSAHCKWNIGWARFLKPGRARNEPVQTGSPYRHAFDGTSYCIGAELPHEMQADNLPSVASGLVAI